MSDDSIKDVMIMKISVMIHQLIQEEITKIGVAIFAG